MKKILIIITTILFFVGCNNEKEEQKTKIDRNKYNFISAKEAANKINITFIDTRSYDEFNGWDIKKIGVNGHIKGAKSVPHTIATKENFDTIIQRKGIEKNKELIIYGDDTQKVADLFIEAGYSTSILDGGIHKWKEEKFQINSLKNYQNIVPITWVKDLIDGKNVEFYDNRPYKIFNAGWDESNATHKKGHIKGSYWFHTGWLEVGPLWNKINDEEIEKKLLEKGITANTLLILYGNDITSASRVASIAKYAGVEDVRIINGSYDKWKEAGFPVETTIIEPTPEQHFGSKVPANPNFIINIEEAINLLKSEEGDLISIRSWKEYQGKVSGYDYIKPRGRIEGAKWGKGGSDPWHLEDYRSIDENYMRPYTEIKEMWEALKIDTSRSLAFYCGTGWRASEVWFYARSMGLENVSVYDGGWKEWSENPKTKNKVLKDIPENLNEEKYPY